MSKKPSKTSSATVLSDDGACRHLIAGTRLPDIALTATFDAPVNLARQQERAVIFVYPFTGTPGKDDPPGWDQIPGAHGSTPEAEAFRDHYPAFGQLGWEVYGVSGQSTEAQIAFAARSGIPFQLLSDADHRFAEALALPTFKAGRKSYLTRLTLLTRNGVIYRTIYPVADPGSHPQALLRELTAARGEPTAKAG